MNIKIKKLHSSAVIPTYAKFGDAGLDLTAVSITNENETPYIQYNTGLAVEIPEGYVGLLFPRSSISKTPYYLSNSVGVIDSGYRGEIAVRFKAAKSIVDGIYKGDINPNLYKGGDKIAQLIIIPIPQINLIEVDELSESERGESGFGSTGK